MNKNFEKKLLKARQGKEIFRRIFDLKKLSLEDTFLLVLTANDECIRYGIKYLPDFIKLYHRKNIYILLSNSEYTEVFSKAGSVKVCKNEELENLAIYLNIFHRKEEQEVRIVFLTEKDEYGLVAEELIEKKEFTLEEYVAVSLYQLKGIEDLRS